MTLMGVRSALVATMFGGFLATVAWATLAPHEEALVISIRDQAMTVEELAHELLSDPELEPQLLPKAQSLVQNAQQVRDLAQHILDNG